MPEVRVAAQVATYLRFDAPIDQDSVEVEGGSPRFRWMDTGERLVALEPSRDVEPGRRLLVRVRYKDGASPALATLALVSHPSLVDKEVEVVRHPPTGEALQAQRASCEPYGPADLALSERLDLNGVQARRIEPVHGAQSGLRMRRGMSFRATRWALASVYLHNLPGQKPWAVQEARLVSKEGPQVQALSVRMDRLQLAPGETGLVVVETEEPHWTTEEEFRLELVGTDGRRFSLDAVKL